MDKPHIKDRAAQEYVDYLESRLKVYEESPYHASYMALKLVVDKLNEQITSDIETGKDVDYDALTKRASKLPVFLTQLDSFKTKMSPSDRKSLEKEMHEKAGLAEKMALRNKNGAS